MTRYRSAPPAHAPAPGPRRGELYFELHRGTYTSHAANKSDNRACELLLREAEAAGALAAAVLDTYCYPRAELDAIWKDVLLFQFHDVLPGSAIGRVYDVTAVRYDTGTTLH